MDDITVTRVNLDLPKPSHVVHVHSCLLGNMSKSCKVRIFKLSIDTVVMQLRCILQRLLVLFTTLLILTSSLVCFNAI